MRKTKSFLVLGLIVLLASPIYSMAERTSEHNLAIIHAGYDVGAGHITVVRFRNLLDQLSETFIEGRQKIADSSANCLKILKTDVGIKGNLMNIMEGMNTLYSSKNVNSSYIDKLAVYINLRNNSYSHTEAIQGIKAIIR